MKKVLMVCFLIGLLLLTGCVSKHQKEVDTLNKKINGLQAQNNILEMEKNKIIEECNAELDKAAQDFRKLEANTKSSVSRCVDRCSTGTGLFNKCHDPSCLNRCFR